MFENKLDPTKCQHRVFSGSFDYQCSKPSKVERDGKLYCTIHDPEYVTRWQNERLSRLYAESRKQEEHYAIESAKSRALSGLTLEECQALTPSLARAAPEMYEALKEIIARLNTNTPDYELINIGRAALAKAEGIQEEK